MLTLHLNTSLNFVTYVHINFFAFLQSQLTLNLFIVNPLVNQEGAAPQASRLRQERVRQGACQVEPHRRRQLRIRPRQCAQVCGSLKKEMF